MAKRTTRSKMKWQAEAVHDDLHKAQVHMVQLAALADNRSDYVNDNLPDLVAGLEIMIRTWEQFREGI